MTAKQLHPLPYRLSVPVPLRTAVIFASPHSGDDYPADLRARSVLDMRRLRSSEDAFVDRLLAGALEVGAACLVARYPRAYIDLNRGADELDAGVIEDLGPAAHRGARVVAGLGVIPRVVSGSRAIYRGKLTRAEAEARIARVWTPYHDALEGLMVQAQAEFGRAILIDVHSMPGEALDCFGARRPQVVLGDRYGASAEAGLVNQVAAAFESEGLRVGRNSPFAGAYIAQRYGAPTQGRHVIQVEIDRALYMDEDRIAPRPDFEAFQARIGRVIARIAQIGQERLPLAAE
ncbi:N-formylglutamate amidohydrolase [Pseudothioclava nitratireducens]|uniref:N-formylglutamate amidohydrolase n=1 Tax=Pseudothioclava nitratireducens TaxID=1928646 RepID=UPI0023DB9DAB|nr:N-formylglutamate amidohydrolase [Defluviimonas nitratireducens]MDF1620303.1 N-formylglutamate amidohydrolase [Defluviimonas nitratireducens]